MFKKIKEFFFPTKPLVLKNEVNLKGLEKKTKTELEKLGRKIGVELDKRLTKDKLIKQIKKGTVYKGSATEIVLQATLTSEKGKNSWVPYIVKQSNNGCVIKAQKNNHCQSLVVAFGIAHTDSK